MTIETPVIIPNCEYCNSPMKFFDEAWVEGELLIVASVICINQDCLNSSVIHIHAQQSVQPTMGGRRYFSNSVVIRHLRVTQTVRPLRG
jgi:predicted DCC family thiol-disulfide oxidoreductase YuxK